MQDQFGAATPQEHEQLSKLKARMSSQLLPFRDPNGFRKLIVLLTEPGLAPYEGYCLSWLSSGNNCPDHVSSVALVCLLAAAAQVALFCDSNFQ